MKSDLWRGRLLPIVAEAEQAEAPPSLQPGIVSRAAAPGVGVDSAHRGITAAPSGGGLAKVDILVINT